MLARENFAGLRVGTRREHTPRIAERDWRDRRDEAEIQSVHVAPLTHVSHFTRPALWCWRTVSASC